MNAMEPEQSPHLSEYYYVVRKHRWTVIASLIIIVTLTMIFSFMMRPVYRATATLAVEKERSTNPLSGDMLDYESFLNQSIALNTHLKLITSRPIMRDVVEEVGLDHVDQDTNLEVSLWKRVLSRIKKNIRLLLGKEEKFVSTEERMENLTDALRNKTDIELVRDTILLNVSVEDHDPLLAKEIANAIARSYIQFNISNRLEYSQNTLAWMSDQLYEVKKRLEDSEAEFLAFKQDEKIFSVEGKQKVIDQKIQEFNDAYLEARNRRLTLDASLNELKSSLKANGDISQTRSLIDNPLIGNLYNQLLDLEVELSSLSKVYKQKHPKVVQISTQIENTRNKLKQEIDKEVESMEAERAVLLAREDVLQKTLGDFEDDALDTNRKELEYTILERNVETNQKLYDTLLSKVKEADISGNIDASNIRITEDAVMPNSPVKPRKKRNLVLSVIFGLMTGIGLSFLWEYLDRSLRTEEEVQKYLDLPVLSVIPIADSPKSKGHRDKD
jgi:succinoglycan biosynthesis transport protein ExoP